MTTTRKLIGSAAFALALTGGGIAGALLGTPGTSGAQESSTTTAEEGERDTGVAHAARRGKHLEVAATALGITEAELRDELKAGKTIAEVAAAEGVDIDSVIDALVTAATEDIRERITARVNGELPERGHRHRHGPRSTASDD